MRALRLISRQGENSELLIRAQHDKVRTKDYTRLLGLVIVDLNGSVVGSFVGHNSGATAGINTFAFLGKEFLNNGRKILVPSLFITFKEVGFSNDGSDTTSLDISNINTFVGVKRNNATRFQDFDIHRWNIFASTVDHPAITRTTNSIFIFKLLTGAEEKSFLRVEDVNLLDSILESLSRSEKERCLTSSEFTGTKARLSSLFVDRINNDAVFARR
jgi:hypothetical protein